MGRKEERYRKRINDRNTAKGEFDKEKLLKPFIIDKTKYIPIEGHFTAPATSPEHGMTQEEFTKVVHQFSDKELNRIIYQNTKDAIEMGIMPEWPEDDYGIVMWFAFEFITPEMREAFPAIAKEYLSHYDKNEEFKDIPYPRPNEKTWDDAFYFRLLLMMLFSARRGSLYSKNFLLSLYKVYYKHEYNQVKRLDKLTYLNVLEFHDEQCYRNGLSSGHAVDGSRSFKDKVINERLHEPGWTNVYGKRAVTPVPVENDKDKPNAEILHEAASFIREMHETPDEPPLQPTASRLFVMCDLMGIQIEKTCNEQAFHMNQIIKHMTSLEYLNSPDYRRLRSDVAERTADFVKATYPEMADPFEYQKDENYLGLQIAEEVMYDVFRRYDTHIRMPYKSKEFNLLRLVSDITFTLNARFPDLHIQFSEVLCLAMVQYLSECLCEVLNARDKELDTVLKFDRRLSTGEWNGNDDKAGNSASVLTEKVLKSVEALRDSKNEKDFAKKPEPKPEEIDLEEEVRRLRTALEEKEAALAEAEQKIIRQRVLYEKSHTHEMELQQMVDDHAVEHTELIALRDYIYNRKTDEDSDIELDEQTRDQIISMVASKNVAVLGGTERWSKRMKALIPTWSFIPVGDDSIGSYKAIEQADFVYIYTNVLKHSQYYKAMNIIRNGKKMLYYLDGANIDKNLSQFQKELCH